MFLYDPTSFYHNNVIKPPMCVSRLTYLIGEYCLLGCVYSWVSIGSVELTVSSGSDAVAVATIKNIVRDTLVAINRSLTITKIFGVQQRGYPWTTFISSLMILDRCVYLIVFQSYANQPNCRRIQT